VRILACGDAGSNGDDEYEPASVAVTGVMRPECLRGANVGGDGVGGFLRGGPAAMLGMLTLNISCEGLLYPCPIWETDALFLCLRYPFSESPRGEPGEGDAEGE